MTSDLAMVALAGTVAWATVQLVVVAFFAFFTMRAARSERSDVVPLLAASTLLAGVKLLEGVLLWPATTMASSVLGVTSMPLVNGVTQVLALVSSSALWGTVLLTVWRLMHPSDAAAPPPARRRDVGVP